MTLIGPVLSQAAYHAVPIVGIPLIADQLDNVMKAVHRGFGLAVSPKGGLKASNIGAALDRILAEPGFKEAAVKLSNKLHSRTRTPAQEAAGECGTNLTSVARTFVASFRRAASLCSAPLIHNGDASAEDAIHAVQIMSFCLEDLSK